MWPQLTNLLLLILAAPSLAAPYRGLPTIPFIIPGGHPPDRVIPTSTAPEAIPTSVVPLPGFNHLAQNNTQAVTKSPDSSAAFSGTCVQVTLGGHGKIGMTTLEGRCVDDAGMWWDTSLNLNSCVGNVGGRLVYEENGGFDATCRPCTLDYIHDSGSVLLKCNCLDQVRFPRYTALEMGPGGKIALSWI
ncbi:uncharacterized protein TrAFT101_001165 [Trichoderma asperellum]|uniref:uncharacterized protein n=1 Tax=Trichoderma asperellum TaxID=101201 RepID=UPI003328DA0B|nr:hypothetical protein TrAFT101_001165 [Trichoderma asperellum]